MPRKGNIKVRTGCLTCKVRKVKCDEEKPHCKRCTSTGRKCDGYAPPPTTSSLTWHRPRHMFPDVNQPGERRCLEFFCDVAAPTLSGPLDGYFWTHLTIQFSQMEPAMRHAVVAVASLYEQAHCNPDAVYLMPDNDVVLRHYNAAIHHLKGMKNESLVLLACVMFVCIEFLRGNREAAIEHCRHGISILSRVENAFPWTREYLSPIFRRLSIIPFFFSVGEGDPLPTLGVNDIMPASFASLAESEYYLDGLLGRTIRLVRNGDKYRVGALRNEPISPDLIDEQNITRGLLDGWNARFHHWTSQSQAPVKLDAERCNMLMRYQICRIWVETPFSYHETVYDDYLLTFSMMIDWAIRVQSSPKYNSNMPRFIFEMGFMPLLFFIVTKCRCLETRLQALFLMKTMGAIRENLWDMVAMFAAAKRIVEIEHGTKLSDDGLIIEKPTCPGFPPDEVRIRDATTEPYPVVQIVDGVEVCGRLGGFYRRTPDDGIYVQSEFLHQPSWCR
ncbi:hypothetical protein GGS20DRAFT_553317 [Poronia punctata]|nr:hypothetical protein GGS20DRAFT_553317 [Poronia punctata]